MFKAARLGQTGRTGIEGMLATLFQAAMRMRLRPIRLAVPAIDLQRPMAAITHISAQFRQKRRHRQFEQ